MWVQLTRMQHQAAIDALPFGSIEVERELTAEVRYSGERQVHVYAAFVAWEIARDALAGIAFGPQGGRKHGLPYPISAALRRITERTNWLLKHPALRGVSMQGHHAHQIPAWEMGSRDDFGRAYSPSPIMESPFVLLLPRFHDQSGARFTTWGEKGIQNFDDRLADEAVHWAVLGRSVPEEGEQPLPPRGEG